MKMVVVCLSGGLDSAVTLAQCLDQGNSVVKAVNFQYGSKHGMYERETARRLAGHYKIPLEEVYLPWMQTLLSSALLRTSKDPIPTGHYDEESMRQTVVPGRNTIFAAVLLGVAESMKAEEVWFGMHAGDHHIYPDCRPMYFHALRNVFFHATDGKVDAVAPFLFNVKASVVARGEELMVPMNLTRTCYRDQKVACGTCGSCQERLEAFASCGLEDPLEYQSRTLIAKPTGGP